MSGIPHLYLDGVELESLGAASQEVLDRIKALGAAYEYYKFPVGKYMLEYYLCYDSVVEVDSNRYLTLQLDEDEDIEDLPYCDVVFTKTMSKHDTFKGACSVTGVTSVRCLYVESDVTVTPPRREDIIYTDVEFDESTVIDTSLSAGAWASGSHLVNCVLKSLEDKVSVEESQLDDCMFFSDGLVDVRQVQGENCHVFCRGLLRVSDVYWNSISLTVPSMYVPTRMYFLEIHLPTFTLYCYQTAKDTWVVTSNLKHDRGSIEAGAPDFDARLLDLLIDRDPQRTVDMLQYVHDCINSRLNLLKALDVAAYREYEKYALNRSME